MKATALSQYNANFVAAMRATGTKNVKIVALLQNRVTPNDVSNWMSGRRPIPAKYANEIAGFLGTAPEYICAAYEQMLLAGVPVNAATDAQLHGLMSGHLMMQRLEGFGHFAGPPRIVIPELVARPRIGTTSLKALRWTLQPSIAMDPEIRQGVMVFVDTSVNRHEWVVDRGIYAYTLWGRPDIRRILVRRDTWALTCADSETNATIVPEADLEQVSLHGAVVGWINPP